MNVTKINKICHLFFLGSRELDVDAIPGRPEGAGREVERCAIFEAAVADVVVVGAVAIGEGAQIAIGPQAVVEAGGERVVAAAAARRRLVPAGDVGRVGVDGDRRSQRDPVPGSGGEAGDCDRAGRAEQVAAVGVERVE